MKGVDGDKTRQGLSSYIEENFKGVQSVAQWVVNDKLNNILMMRLKQKSSTT